MYIVRRLCTYRADLSISYLGRQNIRLGLAVADLLVLWGSVLLLVLFSLNHWHNISIRHNACCFELDSQNNIRV